MADNDNRHTTTYFVNGEEETTDQEELTVGQILERAGFQPITDYILKGENPPKDYGNNYDQSVKVHNNERFSALHQGPTPTS